MTLALIPNATEIEAKASRELAVARALVIENNDEYAGAGAFLRGLKGLQAEIDATFDPVVESAHRAHKTALEAKRKHTMPILEAERIVKGKLGAWVESQEKIRREEEARLREQARIAEQERLLAEAVAAEAEGDDVLADEIVHEAVTAPAPIVNLAPSTPKVSGISYRDEWDFEIIDEAKLPRQYTIPDPVRIRGVVRAMKGQTNIPGVRVFSKKVVAAGR